MIGTSRELKWGLVSWAVAAGLHVSVWAAPARVIDCTVGAAGEVTTLVIENHSIALTSPDGLSVKRAVTRRRVSGAGSSSRTELEFAGGGKVTYHDQYGCLSQAQAALGRGNPALRELHCVTRGGPTCR